MSQLMMVGEHFRRSDRVGGHQPGTMRLMCVSAQMGFRLAGKCDDQSMLLRSIDMIISLTLNGGN
jgi:hypothetical protein